MTFPSAAQDAYFKLKNVIDEANAYIQACGGLAATEGGSAILSPENGNVFFASALFGLSFTLEQFSAIYADTYGGFPAKELAARLWGDFWFDESSRKFKRTAPSGGGVRSFVHFVLEPLYKMFSQVWGCFSIIIIHFFLSWLLLDVCSFDRNICCLGMCISIMTSD